MYAVMFVSPAFVSNVRVGGSLSLPAPTLYLGIPFSPSRVDSLGPASYLSAYTAAFMDHISMQSLKMSPESLFIATHLHNSP